MTLRYVSLSKQGDDAKKTQALFESAFPEEERPPFSMMLAWNHDDFYGVYRENEFVALVDLIRHQDMVYVFFLAVEEAFRGQGIGSQILSDLKNQYPSHRLFLLAEEVDERYPDNAIRQKRIGFYGKNGLIPTGDVVLEFGVRYFLLCHNGYVSKKDFVAVMASLIGEANAKRFYAHV